MTIKPFWQFDTNKVFDLIAKKYYIKVPSGLNNKSGYN